MGAEFHICLLTIVTSQQTRDVQPMLVRCWASVADGGPNTVSTLCGCFVFKKITLNTFFVNTKTCRGCCDRVRPSLEYQTLPLERQNSLVFRERVAQQTRRAQSMPV